MVVWSEIVNVSNWSTILQETIKRLKVAMALKYLVKLIFCKVS
jgi:hypothetical protein